MTARALRIPAAAATTPAAAAGGGKLTGLPTSCPSVDEVMSNLGLKGLTVSGNDPSLCQYLYLYLYNGSSADPYVEITFSLALGMTAATLESSLRNGQSGVAPVSGLADAAFSFTGDSGSSGLGSRTSFDPGATVTVRSAFSSPARLLTTWPWPWP